MPAPRRLSASARRTSPPIATGRALALALVLSLPAGCAAPTQYMGIALTPGTAPADLQSLAARAMAGDKQAQLDLGIAYEDGKGVGVDLERAKKLYRMAAATSGGTIWVYQPPSEVGGQGSGESVNFGPLKAGLQEAASRLNAGSPEAGTDEPIFNGNTRILEFWGQGILGTGNSGDMA